MKKAIEQACDELKAFLIKKNTSYGNSACDPINVFSKLDSIEQLNCRIDDKLQRIKNGKEYPGDDTELDLTGYLILKRAVRIYLREKKGG